jgi:hypothetical protein
MNSTQKLLDQIKHCKELVHDPELLEFKEMLLQQQDTEIKFKKQRTKIRKKLANIIKGNYMTEFVNTLDSKKQAVIIENGVYQNNIEKNTGLKFNKWCRQNNIEIEKDNIVILGTSKQAINHIWDLEDYGMDFKYCDDGNEYELSNYNKDTGELLIDKIIRGDIPLLENVIKYAENIGEGEDRYIWEEGHTRSYVRTYIKVQCLLCTKTI